MAVSLTAFTTCSLVLFGLVWKGALPRLVLHRDKAADASDQILFYSWDTCRVHSPLALTTMYWSRLIMVTPHGNTPVPLDRQLILVLITLFRSWVPPWTLVDEGVIGVEDLDLIWGLLWEQTICTGSHCLIVVRVSSCLRFECTCLSVWTCWIH